MKTIYAIIAILLFSLIFFSNLGCNKSTDLTSPLLSPPSSTEYNITLNISGIIWDRNGNPIDTASVRLSNWRGKLQTQKRMKGASILLTKKLQ